MSNLSQKEAEALRNLEEFVKKAMRSKPTLAVLSKLESRGMIVWDPFVGSAELTPLGQAAVAAQHS